MISVNKILKYFKQAVRSNCIDYQVQYVYILLNQSVDTEVYLINGLKFMLVPS